MEVNKTFGIFILGYFGYLNNQLDGQTVKTRMIKRLFEEKLGSKISFFDTEILKSSKLRFLYALLRIFKSKYVIYIPAQNNLNKFFPTLYILSRLFRFKIQYFVIGGWLPDFLKKHYSVARILSKIDNIYTETGQMQSVLKTKFGISNTILFPNFRFRQSFISTPIKAIIPKIESMETGMPISPCPKNEPATPAGITNMMRNALLKLLKCKVKIMNMMEIPIKLTYCIEFPVF